ncbi:indole-3-glycerol phosphate synthase TrpC [Algiphilus aromaticivorans]|jgi:indole-3-glycerol phosphate synthase|uniref:indole-3-glycerol phosphate synthase TrpC n=1 Tax=Algiphilus aromaticivorans TaxID=382454 RepID=UPI0005C20860|nr:indole-3-glycerol phosphate synthase TrpC [Algiphilus aromaticivorans]
MSDILETILARKAEELSALRKRYRTADLEELAGVADAPRGFAEALTARARQGAAVIAEIKRASPSKGLIRQDFDGAWLAGRYAEGGAATLSVLTDRDFFGGGPEVLEAARAACALPVLRKDFLIDPLQVLEARAMAADCVLLIAAALSAAQMRELDAVAREAGMDVLVEVHDGAELEAVQAADLKDGYLLGINNRDLRNFETRLETTLDLLPRLAPGAPVVTESGINTRDDVARMQAAGVQRFLIGESLMRAVDPGVALADLIG